MFFDTLFIVEIFNEICNKISSDKKMKEISINEGYGTKYYKRRQLELFNKYLVKRTEEQDYYTTWELYEMAQKQLLKEGYLWNPEWNLFTPNPNEKEYVKGSRRYLENREEKLHRYGEDRGKQNYYLRRIAFLCERAIQNNSYKYRMIDWEFYRGWSEYDFVQNAKKNFENSTMYSKDHTNRFGEKLTWYDDNLLFTPRKNFYPLPTQEQLQEMKENGIDYEKECYAWSKEKFSYRCRKDY